MPYPRYLQSLLDFPSTPPPSVNPYKTQKPTSSSSRGLNPSILIIALILTFVFLISVAIHFLLRHIDRLRHRRSSASSPSPSQTHQPLVDRLHVSPDQQTLIDSLPLFSFDSIATVQTSAPDCAVCLSKFEPHDQLRFLPACCHAFHSRCIDTWLSSNQTCPLCRSSIHVPDSDKTSLSRGESFRLEMGSVSRRRPTDSGAGSRRSYSMGSFDYVIDDDAAPEVSVPVGGGSDYAGSAKDKEEDAAAAPSAAGPSPPGSEVAEVAGGRGWLKECVDRLASSASSSFSSTRALSFRLRGGFGVGCSRRSDAAADSGSGDSDGNKIGEEASNFFRWLTGHDW